MSQNDGLNRRSFLRNAGMTALVGAVGSGSSLAAAAGAALVPAADATQVRLRHAVQPLRHRFDQMGRPDQHRPHRQGQHRRRHGHRRHGLPRRAGDHQGAPGADAARELGLPRSCREVVHRRHRRLEQEALRRRHQSRRRSCITTGVHPGIIAALRAFSPPGSKVLLTTPTYNGFYGDLRNTGTIAGRERDEGRQRPLHDRLRRLRAPHQPRHQHVHPVQPAEPDRQLLVAGGSDAHRRNLPAAAASSCSPTRSTATASPRARSTRRSPACRTRRSSTTASRSRRRASRSASRR